MFVFYLVKRCILQTDINQLLENSFLSKHLISKSIFKTIVKAKLKQISQLPPKN